MNTYRYDPYGKATHGRGNSVANPWQFAGGYYDSVTGLVKFGQRYDDPSVGRWTQQDPIPQGNRYVYAGDNPINFTDPTGASKSGLIEGVATVVGGAAAVAAGVATVAAAPFAGPAAPFVAAAGIFTAVGGVAAITVGGFIISDNVGPATPDNPPDNPSPSPTLVA